MLVDFAFWHQSLLHRFTQSRQATTTFEVHLTAKGIAIGCCCGGMCAVARNDGVGLIGIV